jgi:hypothetical protein
MERVKTFCWMERPVLGCEMFVLTRYVKGIENWSYLSKKEVQMVPRDWKKEKGLKEEWMPLRNCKKEEG